MVLQIDFGSEVKIMKWVGGAVLLIITIILLVMAIFMFPWFSTKTTYYRDRINDSDLEYWDEKLDGVERDWDETTYGLTDYEMKSSENLDWFRDGQNGSSNSGKIEYTSSVKSGGWDGSYRDMAMEDYPVPGYLAGGQEQLNVYTYTYYMIILAIILAVVGIICIIIAGFEKINALIPKIIVGITIIFVVLAPLYFALALPPAIKTDHEKLQDIKNAWGNETVPAPPEGGSSIMGEANEKSEGGKILSHIDWGPELGWWLSIIAIFTCIITIAFIEGKRPVEPSTPDYVRRKYHEFDRPPKRPPKRSTGTTYEQEYIPPPSQRGRSDGYYDDDYGGARGGEYYDDHDYVPPRSGPSAPPPSPGYGRAPPRPPRRNRPPR